ncbi:probable E3 ubiquitin-protein ligase ZFP1 [Phaseolus vulgaris]|uniref:probable E3 ubiquitin-protein ligase ZFP1 n=1 Tax=Phaseolus vulgaris TaxID=3885 RepID=UPI0035CA202D
MITVIGLKDMDEMSEENIFWPNMCRVAMRENIDSHYLLNACDNGMVYGRRPFNGVQHQPIHTAPTPSLEIVTNDPQSYHDIARSRSRSDYRFLHPQYQAQLAQEMRGHSIAFHPPLTLPTNPSSTFYHPQYQAQPTQEMRGHSIDFHPPLTLPTNPSSTFLHPQYQAQPAQEMRGHSIDFHPPLTLPTNPSSTFLHPQYQAQPAQEMRGHSIDFHPTLTLPTNPSSTCSVRMTTHPHWRSLPPQAFLQDDDVSWLDDHDSDMHLDIDDMSYEELLELGERISNVGTGLLDEIIARKMKTKTYLLSNNSGEVASEEQENDLCIICQDEYKNKQEIGILQCGHGYHADCIRKWLHEENVCPLCKSEALTLG